MIPVGHVGTVEIQPPDTVGMKLFKSCAVRFGAAMRPSDFGDPDDPRLPRLFTDAVMFEISRLSEQVYVDTYAGSHGVEPTATSLQRPVSISVPKGRPTATPPTETSTPARAASVKIIDLGHASESTVGESGGTHGTSTATVAGFSSVPE